MNLLGAIMVLVALLLDAWFGEPRRWHPLVGFGRLTQGIERCLYADRRWRGALAVVVLLVPLTFLTQIVIEWAKSFSIGEIVEILVLYLAIGWHSLASHARAVYSALNTDNLPLARQRVAWIVSRDTRDLDEQGIAKAAVESVLENGNDAIFAAIFWFIIAGAPGVVLYRLSNTLDAMWGYRNARYERFGWAAARLDDGLNWVPARLTALSYALVGQTATALRCWYKQGARWKSPNAGPVMAAGAGSLGICLGGAASYHGKHQPRLLLGKGRAPNRTDIEAALRLIRRSLMVWVVALLVCSIGT